MELPISVRQARGPGRRRCEAARRGQAIRCAAIARGRERHHASLHKSFGLRWRDRHVERARLRPVAARPGPRRQVFERPDDWTGDVRGHSELREAARKARRQAEACGLPQPVVWLSDRLGVGELRAARSGVHVASQGALRDQADEARRRQLAASPNLDDATVSYLLDVGLLGTRFSVAARARLPAWLLARLANDREPELRAQLAGLSQTPAELLAALSRDADSKVRIAALTNAHTPLEAVLGCTADASPRVRRAPVRVEPPPMAMTGIAPRAHVVRPKGSSVGPLTIERAWDRQFAWAWVVIGLLLEVVAARAAAPPLARVALALFGLLATYGGLCYALNKTTLAVAGGLLSVTRGPLPVGGEKRLVLDEITQIFVRTRFLVRRKNPWMGTWSPREEVLRYQVVAELADGRELRLLGDLEDVDEARRFERTLERHIGITDDPMRSLAERRA